MIEINITNPLLKCPICGVDFHKFQKADYFSKSKGQVCSEKCLTSFAEEKSKPTEIIIKPEALDISQVQEGEGAKGLYRPLSFNEYIGQDEAKARVADYIKGCTEFNESFPHTFLSAPSGCGKTTFALITSSLLNKTFVSCTAQEIKTEQQMVDKIIECNGGIIFLDEAHRLNNRVGTFLLPILEDFKIQDKKIKPFTMIMATTHKGNLSKNLEALIQRFSLQIHLNHYDVNELTQIIKQYHQKKYVSVLVPDSVITEIAKNCRRTPRIALSLLKEYIFTKDLKRVFKNNHIIKDGLTENDVKVLEYIARNDGAGQASLAKFLRVEPNTYAYEIEPYLMFLELLTVENKRKLTEKGKETLNGLI